MFCSISGKATKEPVLSPVSGHIFDKTLIETYIDQTGKDPVNNQPLSAQDLIQVNSHGDLITAAPNNLTAIPNLLSQFQKEWDALLIELFTLRKQLKESREELSILLYHKDAAVRVAAKAVAQRDEAKKALEVMATSMAEGDYERIAPQEDEEEEEDITAIGISEEIANEIKNSHSILFNEHKTNKKKANFNSDSSIKLSVTDNFELQPILEKLAGFKTAIMTSIRPNPNANNLKLITFDNDHAIVFDNNTNEVVSKLTPKKKKLITSTWCQSVPVLGFEEGSIYMDDKILKSNKDLIKLIAHPLLPILIAVHKSGFQFFYNNEVVFKTEILPFQISSLDLHGDGVLLSIGGDDGCIYIYDISLGTQVSKLNDVQDKQVTNLKFASNGYWLIGEIGGSNLKIFDLRKESLVFEIEDVKFLDIDYSSQLIYLLKQDDAKIEITYLRYFKKLKTWNLNDGESLFVDEVSKLKKKQITHVVDNFKIDESINIAENSNKVKKIEVALV